MMKNHIEGFGMKNIGVLTNCKVLKSMMTGMYDDWL